MITVALLIAGLAFADEGMWMPEQLPELSSSLTAMGLEIPAEQLADPLAAPLGAIVSLGGCSASFLSEDGLIGTNHHCVAGYLAYNSTGEQNYEHNGFLARSRVEELSAGPTARVFVVASIDEVTDQVLADIGKRTRDAERHELIERAKKELVAGCEAQPNRRCSVASFYAGQEYRLVTALEIQDVRLVYAPHSRVGDYGGEIDNWMWPRHAGDFALLRAYVGPDGASAPYSEDNVPYQPPHHLAIDPTGVQPGDFLMVTGFPGATYRHRTVHELGFAIDVEYPYGIALSDEILAILESEAAADPEAAARLGAPIGWVGNKRKYRQGMLDGFVVSGVVERKQEQWTRISAWVDADRARKKRYGPVLEEMVERIEADQATHHRDTLVHQLMWGDLLGPAHTAYRLAVEAEHPDLERDPGFQERDRERIQQRFERLERTIWLPADRRYVRLLLDKVLTLPEAQQIPQVQEWVASQGGLDASLERLYTEPALADTAARLALLEHDRAALEASDDPWVELAVALERFLAPERAADEAVRGAMTRLRPLYMEALLASTEGPVYPDANSTLRVTVGHVAGYSPRDGVLHLPQTTRAGMVAKAGESPFDAPERMLTTPAGERWVDATLGDVPVDFLSTLDITGGNSGSPTLNARGELVGFVFDGNYESMPSDWLFDPVLTRGIHVDIRYALWILDEVEGADALLDELGIE